MKNKNLTILLIFLLIIAGCKTSGSKNSIIDEDIRKGTQGLILEFTKNAPPDKVFEDSIFPIAMKLKNNGAYDIEQGFLALGLEKEYVSMAIGNDEIQRFQIEGKSAFNPGGDEDFITINAHAKKAGPQSETHSSTILATVCYPYKTIFGNSVCVDPDIFGTKLSNKACQMKDQEFKDGQGAPVAIAKIETRMLPDAGQNSDIVIPHFIIHIENKGNGEVISAEKIQDACTNRPLEYKDFNKIKIQAFFSNQELNCNLGDDFGEAEVRLKEKKYIIRCTMEDGIGKNKDAFSSILKVELDYGYTHTIAKDTAIEKILRY